MSIAVPLRWRHSAGGLPGPPDFIEMLESSSLAALGGQLVDNVLLSARRNELLPSAMEIEIGETTILRRNGVIFDPPRALCRTHADCLG